MKPLLNSIPRAKRGSGCADRQISHQPGFSGCVCSLIVTISQVTRYRIFAQILQPSDHTQSKEKNRT